MAAAAWRIALSAAVLNGIGLGGRQAFGVFVSALNTQSGIGLPLLSLALALGQLALGAAQPALGRWADRAGAHRVVVAGAALFMLSTALPAAWPMATVVFASVVISSVASSAIGSNALLLGPVSRAATPAHAAFAVGLLGAGMSFGQLLLGPALQWGLGHAGWRATLLAFAACGLLAIPLARTLRRPEAAPSERQQPVAIRPVLRQATFWRYAGSFAVCGAHVGFLAVHMPGVIERCGLSPSFAGTWIAIAGAANIAGSLCVGVLLRRCPAATVLSALYVLRGAAVLAFAWAPPTTAGLMAFGLLMGATHMATLPPTSALVSARYGTASLGALFGVVMLVHQAGSFAGIWLGGLLASATGTDTWFWMLDAALALCAAALVLPWWDRARQATPGTALRVATR
ncbi:MAG TPA: MFS transporter [Ramlibacter sp.]